MPRDLFRLLKGSVSLKSIATLRRSIHFTHCVPSNENTPFAKASTYSVSHLFYKFTSLENKFDFRKIMFLQCARLYHT